VNRLLSTAAVSAAASLVFGNSAFAADWQYLDSAPIENQNSTSKKKVTVTWSPVKESLPNAPAKTSWSEFPTDDIAASESKQVIWEPIDQGLSDEIEFKIKNKKQIEFPSVKAVAIQKPIYPSGPTFANDKAIWRDEQWHPQITGTVPVGFGPKGWMLSGSIWGIDCVTGADFCENPDNWDDYIDQIERDGDSNYNLSIGFGDAEKLAGVTITARFEETSLPLGERNSIDDNNLFSNYYIGAHLSRNLSPDTALKIGIDNWLDIRDCVDCGFAKSAYGVLSQRIRLNENQEGFLPNAYLTIGLGNGQFRPLDELIKDGVRKQRDEGCATPGYTPDKPCSPEALTRGSLRARSYGQINPIGALALEAFPGMNLIGEWSGRNLNAGFSVRPFEEFGLILTGMWENLLSNCDYGCTVSVSGVPDGIDLKTSLPNALTERARFSFQASLELKF